MLKLTDNTTSDDKTNHLNRFYIVKTQRRKKSNMKNIKELIKLNIFWCQSYTLLPTSP